MTKNSTTIYDIARHLDLSPATVSRAINNDVKISNATIMKVRSAMQTLGYEPKPVHQRQGRRSNGRAHKLSCPNIVFLHNRTYTTWTDVFPAMGEFLTRMDYTFENRYYSPNLSLDNADGIILDFTVTDKHLLKLLRKKITVQMFGNPGQSDILWDQITYDNSRVGVIAAKYLLEQGHEIMAAFYPSNKVARTRAEAFIKTVRDANKRVKTYEHPGLEIDVELLGEQVMQIDSLIAKPTGLFAFNDITAVSLYNCLLKSIWGQGREVEIIACDNNHEILSAVHPRPASIEIHPRQIAKRAIEQLVWRMNNPFDQPITIIVEPELIKNNKNIKKGT